MKSVIWLFLFIVCAGLSADASKALRDPSRLWAPTLEPMIRVQGTRVVLADYDLIREDFPEVARLTEPQIDEWLTRNASFISIPQANQQNVNTKISWTNETRTAFRPREYRRAHVFKMDTGGLIDAKGSGALDPHGDSHNNGLATLGDMLREYIFEKLVHSLFERDGRFDTVRSYAVIDYGFDIKHPDGNRDRAGLVLRQAHARSHKGPQGWFRSKGQPAMLPNAQQETVELFLRKFGLSSSILSPDGKVEIINLQGDEDGAIVDFGAFLLHRSFHRPVAFAYDKFGNAFATDILMTPRDLKFVRPDPDLMLPFNIWGFSVSGEEDSKRDNLASWSHEIATKYSREDVTRFAIDQHLRNMVHDARVERVLSSIPPMTCQALFR